MQGGIGLGLYLGFGLMLAMKGFALQGLVLGRNNLDMEGLAVFVRSYRIGI